jgi:antirestriction protein ArdC
MRMSNREIIANELLFRGINFPYDGNNLLTYQEWKKRGFYVRKGEKAFLQVPLWTPCQKVIEKDGKEEIQTYFIMKKASLFTHEQVERIAQTA